MWEEAVISPYRKTSPSEESIMEAIDSTINLAQWHQRRLWANVCGQKVDDGAILLDPNAKKGTKNPWPHAYSCKTYFSFFSRFGRRTAILKGFFCTICLNYLTTTSGCATEQAVSAAPSCILFLLAQPMRRRPWLHGGNAASVTSNATLIDFPPFLYFMSQPPPRRSSFNCSLV